MSVRRILLIAAIFLVEALLVHFLLAQRFPLSGDDYSYLYQAKLFASGKLSAEDPIYNPSLPFYGCIETYCLRDYQGHRFSKYPPGWPALLAVGVKLGVPWLVDPLLGALLIFLILNYVEQRMGKEWVRVTSLLLLFCFFLAYYAGSFRPHVATALFVFAAFLLYDAHERRAQTSKLWLFIAGALLGYSTMIRYLDWVPLTAWIGVTLLRRKALPDLVVFAIGFGALASGNLLYDALLSGDPFQVPSALRPASAANINDRLIISWNGFVVTIVRLANVLWAFPPVILLLVWWRRCQPSSKMKTFLGLFSMSVAIYFFYPASVGGPGPRYFFAYFPFLVLAVVELYRWICHDAPRGAWHLWNFAILTLVVCSLVFTVNEAYTMYGRRDLERTVQQIKDGKNIVLLRTGTYKTAPGDLTRNPPVLSSADTLYFDWCDQSKRDALLKQFPGRNIFVYEYPGRLQKLPPVF